MKLDELVVPEFIIGKFLEKREDVLSAISFRPVNSRAKLYNPSRFNSHLFNSGATTTLEYENKFTYGYKILSYKVSYSETYGNNPVVVLFCPVMSRRIEVPMNLAFDLLKKANISNGIVEDELVFDLKGGLITRSQYELELDKAVEVDIEYSNKVDNWKSNRVKPADLVPGCMYQDKKFKNLIYIGSYIHVDREEIHIYYQGYNMNEYKRRTTYSSYHPPGEEPERKNIPSFIQSTDDERYGFKWETTYLRSKKQLSLPEEGKRINIYDDFTPEEWDILTESIERRLLGWNTTYDKDNLSYQSNIKEMFERSSYFGGNTGEIEIETAEF